MNSEIKTVVREITPELAKQLLGNNGINRKPSQSKIEFYHRQMKEGKWMLTGQGISISKSGRLLDGQNRLYAIIKYGKGVEMVILYGFDDETFKVYDTGKNRTAGEIFYIAGIENANNIAAGIRNYLIRKDYPNKISGVLNQKHGHTPTHYVYISNQFILDTYMENPEFWQAVEKVAYSCYSKYRLFSFSSIIGFIGYMILNKMYGKDVVYQFCYEISGVHEPTCTATQLLREAFSRDKMAIKKMDERTKVAFFIKSWNGYIKKTEMKRLTFNSENDNFPELM